MPVSAHAAGGSPCAGTAAFLLRSLNFGGAERQLVALARGLHERGRPVVVIAFYTGGPLQAELEAAGVPVRILGKRGRWDVVRFLARLLRTLRREAPAVLHSYLDVPNLLAVAMRRAVPGMRLVWGVRASNMDFARYDWFTRLTFRIACRIAPKADMIIVNSEAGRRHHEGLGFPAEKMAVIWNGIDVQRFRRDAVARHRIRGEWGVAPTEPLVGLVGRLDPMKDHATFLRAARLVLSHRRDVRFVCVGNGPDDYRARLQALAEELGVAARVRWAAARADVAAVYSALDLLCSASAYGEGFPNVIAEAMACGVPCVGTDVGDTAYLIGDTGIVVTPESPERMAHAMLAALHDRVTTAERMRKRVHEHFSLERLIDSSETVLWPTA